MSEPETELLRKSVTGLKGVGLEIGCMDGWSSVNILEASNLKLISIDPFVPDSMMPELQGSVKNFCHNINHLSCRSILFEGTSADYPAIGDLSFLLIDGDHEYRAVLLDFLLWTPRLKTGGLLAMHDARMNRRGGAPHWSGPSLVASDWIYRWPDKWEIIGEEYSLLIAKKL